jgi:hypothetical protein
MGKSAKFKKRPSQKEKEVSNLAKKSKDTLKKVESKSIQIDKNQGKKTDHGKAPLQAKSTTSDTMAVDSVSIPKKLGKYEIDPKRPDYVDLLSGSKQFSKTARSKILKLK